ncbi:hypothetical protein [Thauera sp. AutoDN2]|jgi:hypothetical protein|uniref:hypothetical protein n=1 Tax=Thauera sp. AutoDN2 TaxID=3416051 RepID=UPI003F4BB21B
MKLTPAKLLITTLTAASLLLCGLFGYLFWLSSRMHDATLILKPGGCDTVRHLGLTAISTEPDGVCSIEARYRAGRNSDTLYLQISQRGRSIEMDLARSEVLAFRTQH